MLNILFLCSFRLCSTNREKPFKGFSLFYFLSTHKLLILWLVLLLLGACQNTEQKNKNVQTPRLNAPDFPKETKWLNTSRSYQLQDFRGKIVLLDFWTYGCVNCYHILPHLKKLEKEFANELIVIGVHSAKFDTEKATAQIQKAIKKYAITHPIVNDFDSKIWDSYAVKAWPTLVLLDTKGKIVLQKSGENFYEMFRNKILELKKTESISDKKFDFSQKAIASKSVLNFPTKIIADTEGNLWIADTGNHRIVQVSPEGKILQIIGSGKQGFKDGTFAEAMLDEPQGLALKNNNLYIADTRNNRIRKADLKEKTLTSIAGNGARSLISNFTEPVQSLNSPWDLCVQENTLWIANAGSHQILGYDFSTNQTLWKAGSGAEALYDSNNPQQSAFAQPSGLFAEKNLLYISDPEASAIRVFDTQNNSLKTLVGKGLFYFGDTDGSPETARLQHPMAVCKSENLLYIADTYNGKIKTFDLKTNLVKTLISNLDEPNGLCIFKNFLYIVNTNQHQVLRYHIQKQELKAIIIQ
jgi:thiol-disulfide isomerase/thioredoxin